ncbi:MAG: sulfatase [Verrucomicrobia bacterium]|nr:sulfatase [Verrucomicrobiota bacterium]
MLRHLVIVLSFALISGSMGFTHAAAAKKQPNIVFIFSDDHAYQAISAYKDPRKLVETPNIDRIGREGMLFQRCVVPNSICGPSRACVLTGKYNHINGYFNNSNCKFDGNNPPMIEMGKQVKREGYVTDIIGNDSLKWLQQRDKSKPFLLMCQHKAPHRPWEPPIRFLNHDQGRVYDEPASLFDNYENRGLAVRDQEMTLEKTMNRLDVKLSVPGDLNPEQRKAWDAYYGPRNEAYEKLKLQGKDLVHWRYQRYMHDYLGCVKAVDENVGRVLKYLDDEGQSDNTIVVYSADQGFYLGEHGWFDKRWIFEESLRAPLLVRWPGVTKPGSEFKGIVSNIDFAETFLEAAGLPVPADMQGHSLVPVLKGEMPSDWRKSFYYHYYEFPQPHHVRPHYGVVTDRYKLVHFYAPDVDYWELYDREKDPNEMRDCSGDPAYAKTVEELKAEVLRLRQELKVPEADEPWHFGGRRGDAGAGNVKGKKTK